MQQEMIFSAVFFAAVVFLGGPAAGSEFLKMANCDSEHVYCYREDLFALCFDAEKLQVFWKFNVQCFLGANCQQDNFPCASPTTSLAALPAIHAYDLNDACTTTSDVNTASTGTTENANGTTTETTENANGATTETTENANGATTETTQNANGATTQTTENSNGNTTTETTENTQGTPAETTENASETETTTIESTTPGTTTTIGPPTCTNTGTYKGPNCQQYYQCTSVWWWYEPTLVTCSTGQSYNATASACSPDPTCNPQA